MNTDTSEDLAKLKVGLPARSQRFELKWWRLVEIERL
jgi:hypothetical protein